MIRDPGRLRPRALLPPSEFALGEAFIRGDLDVEGDLEAARNLVELLRGQLLTFPVPLFAAQYPT